MGAILPEKYINMLSLRRKCLTVISVMRYSLELWMLYKRSHPFCVMSLKAPKF